MTGIASADSIEGTSQLSIPCVRPLLERDSTMVTLDVKHSISYMPCNYPVDSCMAPCRHDAY